MDTELDPSFGEYSRGKKGRKNRKKNKKADYVFLSCSFSNKPSYKEFFVL